MASRELIKRIVNRLELMLPIIPSTAKLMAIKSAIEEQKEKCDLCPRKATFIEIHVDERNKHEHIFQFCDKHYTKAILDLAENIGREFK